MSTISLQIIKFGEGPPNNVYFAFSLWDNLCLPVALPFESMQTKMKVYQNLEGKLQSRFERQSEKESWNGVLPQPIKSSTKILLLCDHSGSLRSEWYTIQSSIASFVQILIDSPSNQHGPAHNVNPGLKMIGPGAAAQRSIYVNTKVFDCRNELLPVFSGSDQFTEVTTPGFSDELQNATLERLEEDYDPSTNLNGAIVNWLALLNYFTIEANIIHSYLIVFTDGTDQDN